VTARRGALDAVAASWTIESEEDGSEHLHDARTILIQRRNQCGPACGGRAAEAEPRRGRRASGAEAPP